MARSIHKDNVEPEVVDSVTTALVPAGEGGLEHELARQLYARAREEVVDLVGPNGLLTKVTKSVLESALGVSSPSISVTNRMTRLAEGRATPETARR
jgi:hypothetical protein